MGAWQAKKKLNSVVPQVSDSITEEVSIALPTTPISPTYTVEFDIPKGTPFLGFGINLMSPIKSHARVYVKKLVPGGLAYAHNWDESFSDISGKKDVIENGDRLVTLNGHNVSLKTLDEINDLLRKDVIDTVAKTRSLGFLSRKKFEKYNVKMNRSPEAGKFGAQIINSRYGDNHIAVVIKKVRCGQAVKSGILPGDSILMIGTENIHSGARAHAILKTSVKNTINVTMCRGMQMGERNTGIREVLTTDDGTEEEKEKQELEEIMLLSSKTTAINLIDHSITNSTIQEETASFERHEKQLQSKTEQKQKKMSKRIQERLMGRKLLKQSPESFFKKTSMFSELSNDKISSIVDVMKFKTFQSGQHLMTQGQFASEFMVLLKGKANVIHDNTIIHECNVLDVLGEGSLIDGDHVRGATVIATTKVHVLMLTRDCFNVLIEQGVVNVNVKKKIEAAAKKYEQQDTSRMDSLMENRLKYTVEYKKKESLGLQLMCLSKKDCRVFVKNIVSGSQSEKTNKIVPGHQLIEICIDNHFNNVTKMELKKVVSLLAVSSKKNIRVTFAADDVAGVGASLNKEGGREINSSNGWISFMDNVNDEESNLTFAQVNARNEDIIMKIQEEQQENEKKQQEIRDQLQNQMKKRVQQRLKARASIKHSKCLSQCAMFEGLNLNDLSSMIDIMEFITVQKGQNIVTQGDDASEMYIITNECSCVVKVNGKEVRTFKQYDTIGEKSLMKGNHIRGASVTAITDAQLLVLSRVKFDSLNINSDSFNNRVERSSVMYRDVDDARMKAMLNSGERVDEGETSAI